MHPQEHFDPPDVVWQHTVEACAQSYLDAFDEDERGILLLHSSAESTEMTAYLLDAFEAESRARVQRGESCIRFVPLACALEEDRDGAACGDARACIHED